jgi:hypothetical protein
VFQDQGDRRETDRDLAVEHGATAVEGHACLGPLETRGEEHLDVPLHRGAQALLGHETAFLQDAAEFCLSAGRFLEDLDARGG